MLLLLLLLLLQAMKTSLGLVFALCFVCVVLPSIPSFLPSFYRCRTVHLIPIQNRLWI